MREHSISGKAKVAGVIGWPVAHSLSPKLHHYWLQKYGIDGAYIPLAVKPGDLAEVMRALPKIGLRGVNLTLPHKELVLPLLDVVDDAAKAIGAANTVVIDDDGRLIGSNTDMYGFAHNIRPHLPKQKNKAVVLGAGGAARAVCAALKSEGFKQIVVANRSMDKAAHFVDAFGVAAVAWERRADILEDTDLLVNATSLGMQGKEPLAIDLAALPTRALVTDIVYTPLLTPLLNQAKERGNPVVDGLGMLIHQAVPGFKAWFGVTPEVTEEVRACLIAQ